MTEAHILFHFFSLFSLQILGQDYWYWVVNKSVNNKHFLHNYPLSRNPSSTRKEA